MIRLANKYDTEHIVQLLKDFAINGEVMLAKHPMNWSKQQVEIMVAAILAGHGFILLDDKLQGVLIAIKTPCFWMPEILQLQEVMLHGKTKLVIGRLIKKYLKIAREMVASGEVKQASLTTYKNTDYTRLGLEKIETFWGIR